MWDDLMSEAEDDLIEMVRDPGVDSPSRSRVRATAGM